MDTTPRKDTDGLAQNTAPRNDTGALAQTVAGSEVLAGSRAAWRWTGVWRTALAGAAAGLALTLIAYLVVDLNAPAANIYNAAYGPARLQWGLTEADIASPLRRIWFVASAGQWRSALFSNPMLNTPVHLAMYLVALPDEFSLLAIFLMLLGWGILLRRDRRLAALFGLGLLGHWLYAFNYDVWDLYVFYIPGYVLLAMLAAVGLDGIQGVVRSGQLRGTRGDSGETRRDRGMPTRGRRALALVIALAIAAVAVAPILAPRVGAVRAGQVPFMDDERYPVHADTPSLHRIASEVVRRLDRNAIVFTDWKWLWPYYYAAHVEQGRTDLQFVETYPHSDHNGLAESVPEFVRAKLATHPVYFADRPEGMIQAGFRLQPVQIGPQRFYKVER